MNDIDIDAPSFSGEGSNHDFCDSVLSPFAGSDNDSHQLLCAVVVAMSEELKEGNLPSSPDAYFGVACSFLDRIASKPKPQSHVLDPLLTVFSLLVPSVPMAVLKDQSEFFSELTVRVLRSPSPSESSVVPGISSYSRAQYTDFAVSVLAGLTDVAITELYQKAIAPHCRMLMVSYRRKHTKHCQSFLRMIKKTRNQAYDILVEIGHAVGDEETGGKREKLHQFFIKIARGLRATFPYFISAIVKSLAHLASNFADLVLPALNCLRRMYLLRPTENREIIKVIVVKSQAEWLQMHLQSMVEGLLKWQNITKNHLKEKKCFWDFQSIGTDPGVEKEKTRC